MARGPFVGAAGRSFLPWVSLALNFYLLDVRPFWLATILVAGNAALIVRQWGPAKAGHYVPTPVGFPTPVVSGLSRTGAAIIAATALALLLYAAHSWLAQILTFPHDPQRADMLVVIQLGIRRLLQGHSPYAMYQVPWPVTLPYGPVMWSPMIVPLVLHADVRFATILGALFVPSVCALAAVTRARGREYFAATGWVAVLAAIVFSPDVRGFISIGHTEAYWPLLPLFAWTLHRRRWLAAGITCGLLIVARTTMIALVPALLAAVWHHDRRRTWPSIAALAATVALLLLPFAVVDVAAFRYAFYGSYQNVIKGFVWTSTEWAQHTIGVTGLLLGRGWRAAVEPIQAVTMTAVAVATWFRIKRGGDATVWSAIGLLAFSMTTLWPVVYLYFDVFLLFVSAALARERFADGDRPWRWWTPSLAGAAALLAIAAVTSIPLRAAIDVGASADRRYLYAGFSGDERASERDYAWVDGTRAKILVPSLARRDAIIEVLCDPYVTTPNGRQQLTATLNGHLLGAADIGDGWQHLTFRAPARAWMVGTNELELLMSSATSPREAGEGTDTRRLSIAIDRVDVR